ncbi:MAG: GNAT family N-acetyltransferase [Oscillospiraceae bacterium]|jgi:RimJ/RimL family protein N-acetyltransferase|nr:GNAT family N-acetyltransferase [Oscillospiraceae bacterium]
MLLHEGSVKFRAIEESDLKTLQFMFNSEEMNELTTGTAVPVSYAHQLDWFHNVAKHDKSAFRFMVDNLDGETVGMVAIGGFNQYARTAMSVAFKILPEFRSKGYFKDMLELKLKIAFFDLNVRMYCAECLDVDESIRHRLTTTGFTHEATLRDRVYKNGRYYDLAHWSITVEEYLKHHENDETIKALLPG